MGFRPPPFSIEESHARWREAHAKLKAEVAANSGAPERAFVLSENLAAELAAFCALTGDTPHDVVADAIVLMIDGALERRPPGLPFPPERVS